MASPWLLIQSAGLLLSIHDPGSSRTLSRSGANSLASSISYTPASKR